ncbi:N-acetylglutamate synthase [Eremomyces bilateralis CBS 781.70]|uniref:Amino-acid acetyltransferase, mitochondrial n=1 Tax=Eremomyces bilateralis CBS 781.70 TaxID=1392243 RepID=A0A6G1G698_9PEZI|nr:N-acetylglutamate synthase [Eremomyces bilateralis CBS 781.70]KAF1813542.1 N-acetylglutamate synthase [Eremomyces bilateralis CBS 781.70]
MGFGNTWYARRMTPWRPIQHSSRVLTSPKTISHSDLPSSRSAQLAQRCGFSFSSAHNSPSKSKNLNAENWRDREFFYSVLSSTATKRDAKGFLSRFNDDGSKKGDKSSTGDNLEQERRARLKKSGVNLGELFGSARAIASSPVFSQQTQLPDRISPASEPGPLHISIVKVFCPQLLDDEAVDGIGRTISQLARLGMYSAVVVDCDQIAGGELSFAKWRQLELEQGYRIANAIQKHERPSFVIDEVMGVRTSPTEPIPQSAPVRGDIYVKYSRFLLNALREGTLPVIIPLAWSGDPYHARRVEPNSVVLALARRFAGIDQPTAEDDYLRQGRESSSVMSLDRIIVLDPLGGIPAIRKEEQPHIFINLAQEYEIIRRALRAGSENSEESLSIDEAKKQHGTVFGFSNPFTRFLEYDTAIRDPSPGMRPEIPTPSRVLSHHAKNLDLVHSALSFLPPTSSALIVSPLEVAASAKPFIEKSESGGVRTRRLRNPLIHNLLTDKPVLSASLPHARLPDSHSTSSTSALNPVPATFLKKGVPVTIIPDPLDEPWRPPGLEGTTLSLKDDPRIDLARLKYLIEDSFSRPLDAKHYLDRIKGRIAGVIVAGEYEGGAILTWEEPCPGDSNIPPVPYLDKFAVLKRSQGAGGVADILFNAMVRDCFPGGVVWRSRRTNPVNKWYFERAMGVWKIPIAAEAENTEYRDEGWTMFWTGHLTEGQKDNVEEAGWRKRSPRERWQDYVQVCKKIQPSWADRDKPPD